MKRISNERLVEQLTDTDLGFMVDTGSDKIPLGSQRSRKSKLKNKYRINLNEKANRRSRAILSKGL